MHSIRILSLNAFICLVYFSVSLIDFAQSQDKKLVCYFTNWAQYRPVGGKFVPEDIDPFLCTHIIYAFAKISVDRLTPYEWNDESTSWSKGLYERTMALKEINPNLKVLLAVGGWTHGPGPFSMMVHNQQYRQNFVKTTIEYLLKNGFDGLDLDWEYPGSRDGSLPDDKQLFTTLCAELKTAFQPHGLLLTIAVAAGKDSIDKAYEVAKLSEYVDWINLMSYDLHGSWESFTGHNAPLYKRSNEYGDQALLNVDFAVNYWITLGAPPQKIVLGMGTYGRSFRLTSTNTNLGAPASGGATAGTWTREAGFMGYYEVCQKLSQGWTKTWDNEQMVPYAYSSSEWVGYDDIESLKIKVDYVKAKGLGGAMFWTIDLDDFSGTYCAQGKYPLISSVKVALYDGVIPQSTSRVTTLKSTTVSTDGTTTVYIGTTPTPYTQPTIPANIQEKCPHGDGYYADYESSCQNYYICLYTGTATPLVQTLSCAAGLRYDENMKACNYASLVTCGGQTTQTTSTVPTKPTTITTITTSTESPTIETIVTSTTSVTTQAPSISSETTTVPTTITTTTSTSTTTTTTFPLPDVNVFCKQNGYYVDPESDCQAYYYCAYVNTIYAKIYRFECAEGLKYDKDMGICRRDVLCVSPTTQTTAVTTTEQITSTISLPEVNVFCKADGYYVDPNSNCQVYYYCAYSNTIHAKIYRYECAEGLKYDEDMRICRRDAVCATSITSSVATTSAGEITTLSTTSKSSNYCMNGDGLYIDETSQCTKYYECLFQNTPFAKIILHQCPPGTLFDNRVKQCNWASAVTC